MERAAVLCKTANVDAAFVRSFLSVETTSTSAHTDLNLEKALADLERQIILDALTASADNKVAAAKLLGIGERTLWTKLKKHGI
ncbi:MAG: helix-turn-helix domain-containing protein [Candidatus Binatia bacterium]